LHLLKKHAKISNGIKCRDIMRKILFLVIIISFNISASHSLDVFDKELLKQNNSIQLGQASVNAQQKLAKDRPHTYSNHNHINRATPANPTPRNINTAQPPLLLDAPIVVNVDKNHSSLDYPQYIFSGMEGAEIYRQGMGQGNEQSVMDYADAYQPSYKTYKDPSQFMGRADQGIVEDVRFVRGVNPYKKPQPQQKRASQPVDVESTALTDLR
jgi:hypothetical protein